MADQRLTDLGSLTNIINSDLFYVVRSGTSKKVAVSSIISSLAILVPFLQSGTSSTATTIAAKLQETVSVLDFGALGDGSTDDTEAFKNAIAASDRVYVPEGTYRLGTVLISSSVTLYGSGYLKLKDSYDQDNLAWGTANLAMFDIQTSNAVIKFSGLTFDGNEVQQSPATPSLSIIRAWNKFTSTTGDLLSVIVDSCTFRNQTFSSITFNGGNDTSSLNHLSVTNCDFIDGRKGIGNDDPASASSDGFTPFYINAFDRVKISVINNKFIFRKALAAIAEYAPAGIRWTFYDGSNSSEGASGIISNNYFYRVGRKDQKYDGTSTGNNGLGCCDFYARAREVIISNNTFHSCFNSGVRGKTNVNKLVVSGNVFESTPYSINIVPATYESQNGYISIIGNVIRNADQAGISVVGSASMAQTYVNGLVISNNVIEGVTNVDGILGNSAGIVVRYHDKAIISNNVIDNVINSSSGILAKNNISCSILGNMVTNVLNGKGIFVEYSGSKAIVNDNTLYNINGYGITISNNSSTEIITNNNHIKGTVDYGIISLSGNSIIYSGNFIDSISGLSRGMYVHQSSIATISGNIVGTGVTTKLSYTAGNGLVQQSGNNFNPTISYGTAAPSGGTWRKGDIIYNTNPASASFIGWVCTVAGSPGTWTTFGSIT